MEIILVMNSIMCLEIYEEIAIQLSGKDLLNLLSCNKRWREVYLDEKFWKRKILTNNPRELYFRIYNFSCKSIYICLHISERDNQKKIADNNIKLISQDYPTLAIKEINSVRLKNSYFCNVLLYILLGFPWGFTKEDFLKFMETLKEKRANIRVNKTFVKYYGVRVFYIIL